MAELKAGGLGSPSDPAVPAAFANSMAAAMESAINALLSAEGHTEVAVDNSPESRDRRILFLAIAQGVVNHLADNPDAFRIRNSNGDPVGLHIEIGKV